MFFISKRNFWIITFCICFVTGMIITKQIDNENASIQTVALPMTNKTIILDARTSVIRMKEQKAKTEQQRQILI